MQVGYSMVTFHDFPIFEKIDYFNKKMKYLSNHFFFFIKEFLKLTCGGMLLLH